MKDIQQPGISGDRFKLELKRFDGPEVLWQLLVSMESINSFSFQGN
jgi:hypothetical protein